MTELLGVLDAFSTPLKAGWVVWLAWGVGQVLWYRQERRPRYAVRRAVPPPSRRSTAVRKPAPVVHRMVTPEPTSIPGNPVDGPIVDEAFGATALELDSFVADFERNSRHQRQLPH